MTGENDKEGRVSAIASWDTRKYLCKKLINMSISCIVDEAPNEIRATPSGFVPSSLLNSSTNENENVEKRDSYISQLTSIPTNSPCNKKLLQVPITQSSDSC